MTRMKDSGIEWIGEVPEEWGIMKLSQSFSEHKLKNLGNIEQNLLSLSYGKIVRKSIKSSVGLLPESFETYNIIDSNDIVLRLTDLQNDKRSLRTGLANERGIITSAYLTIRLIDGNDSAKYYHYLLHSYDKCKVFYNFGGGVRQGGTWDDLSVLKMIVPPKDEQTKIADYLDKKVAQLDKVKSLLEEQIKTLEDYRQSLIYETVTKGLDKTVPLKESGVDWIGQIPEGWGIMRLKYICGMQSGNNLTSLEISSENDGGKIFPVYGGNGQRGYYSDFTNEGNYCLVGRQGALAGNIHFVSGKFWATDHAIVVYEHTHTYSKYLYYLLKVMNLNQYAFETSAQPGLSVEKILQLETIHCPKGEQSQIADFLDKKTEQINQMIAIKKEQIENINKQRQTLIYDYVTGKRRV
ncbi:restriction endonuclease subunit S [Streptococcus suis]